MGVYAFYILQTGFKECHTEIIETNDSFDKCHT